MISRNIWHSILVGLYWLLLAHAIAKHQVRAQRDLLVFSCLPTLLTQYSATTSRKPFLIPNPHLVLLWCCLMTLSLIQGRSDSSACLLWLGDYVPIGTEDLVVQCTKKLTKKQIPVKISLRIHNENTYLKNFSVCFSLNTLLNLTRVLHKYIPFYYLSSNWGVNGDMHPQEYP